MKPEHVKVVTSRERSTRYELCMRNRLRCEAALLDCIEKNPQLQRQTIYAKGSKQ